MNRQLSFVLSLAVLATLGPRPAAAAGAAYINLELPSARGGGQGYAGTAAQSQDPTVVFLNPAGIVTLEGTQLSFGGHFVSLHGGFEADGRDVKMRSDAPIPNLALTHRASEKLGFGFSLQAPYGMGVKWPEDGPLRYVSTKANLITVVASPSLAYRVHPKVALGGGVTYMRAAKVELNRNLNVDAVNLVLALQGVGTPTFGSPDARTSVQGNGGAFGFHAGVLLEPSPQHAFGASYRSRFTVPVEGDLTITGLSGTMGGIFGGDRYATPVSADLVLAGNLQLGYSFKPNDRWMLSLDAGWFQWSDGRELELKFAETHPVRSLLLNNGNPALLGPEDTWNLVGGVEYRPGGAWKYRAGFMWLPYAQPDAVFNPSFMDLKRRALNVGIGRTLSETLTLDLSYSAVAMQKRDIRNDVGTAVSGIPATGIPEIGVPSPDIDGQYRNFAHLLGFNLVYRFGGK
jgi:long-chain fatty acid transport protein